MTFFCSKLPHCSMLPHLTVLVVSAKCEVMGNISIRWKCPLHKCLSKYAFLVGGGLNYWWRFHAKCDKEYLQFYPNLPSVSIFLDLVEDRERIAFEKCNIILPPMKNINKENYILRDLKLLNAVPSSKSIFLLDRGCTWSWGTESVSFQIP